MPTIMNMYGTMMPTTDIGYAKQHQYASGVGPQQPRKHSVVKDERGRWVLRCTGKPGTREYKGWVRTVTCQNCLAELGAKEEQ